jgi:hypothetical protein
MSRGTQNAVWTLLVVITALVGGIMNAGGISTSTVGMKCRVWKL